MNKKKKIKLKRNIPYLIILILIISNIFFILKPAKEKLVKTSEEFVFYQKCTNLDFNENKKYYKEINYNKFKKLYKKNEVYNIAIIDNTSNTYKSYLSLINHLAYYKSTNIFLLDISKMNKKDNIEFYEIDERFSKIEGHYIISIKNKEIIAITEIEPSQIGSLIIEME